MAGAIGASIAVTVWDDHAKVARSEMVSNLNTAEVQNNLAQNGFSADSTLGIISNLVDKEAITMSANHVFLLFAMVFVFAGLVIWLCPKPKGDVSGMPSH
ncbi:hypothetical protein AMS70_15440 [Acinetobacter sp. JS678]|nr:hypothetical protein AMS70_15440 [Acinetobacter sp. JS678]